MWLEGFILPISYDAKKQGGETPLQYLYFSSLEDFPSSRRAIISCWIC